MAVTPTTIAALPDFTNAEMVKVIRNTIAQVTGDKDSQVTMPGGRTYTYRDIDQLRRSLVFFQAEAAKDVAAAASNAGRSGVVEFGGPTS